MGKKNFARHRLLIKLKQIAQRLLACQFFGSEDSKRGQGLTEFALILPILLLLLTGIIEFGYAFTVYTGMFNAAREGTRYGIVNPMDKANIKKAAEDKMLLVDPNEVDVTIVYDEGPSAGSSFTDTTQVEIGDRVQVHVTYDLPTITPMIQPIVSSLHIESRAARTITSMGQAASLPPSGSGRGSSSSKSDSDGDGVSDSTDNCPNTYNPDQKDTDGDGAGDTCDESSARLEISATADPQVVYSGDPVDFTYTITNTGDLELSSVVIMDSLGNSLDIGTLAAGATTVRMVTENINTTTTNDVSVLGNNVGGTASASDSVEVTVIGPALDLTVAVSPQTVFSGELVTFTYTVENTGDAELTNVTIADSFGTSLNPVTLTPRERVFWEVPYRIYETTTNKVTASGTDPAGNLVSDGESVIVNVELIPIDIHEPLIEGRTMVSGTAQAGETVQIRDLMSDTFPSPAKDSTTVAADRTFDFTGLPPLPAGHVIVVQGYGAYDSATVEGIGPVEPITITTPLCHGNVKVTGQAEPSQNVTLLITANSYEAGTTVDANGYFTFTLPSEQPLQTGQLVGVSGYGESDSATVEACTTNAYLTISPQCGPTGLTVITVKGYNWDFQNKNDDVTINWNGSYASTYDAPKNPPDPWSKDITIDVTKGTHTIGAENSKTPEVTATFLSPCPAPNLVLTDLGLITTTDVISTYQPLDFSVTVANTGTLPVNNLFWLDLYAAEPTTQSIAWGAVSSLGVDESISLTITLDSGFEMTGTHQVWGLADSQGQVSELDENDNTSNSISVTVSAEGAESTTLTGTATIQGETWISLTGIPVPHERASVECRDTDGNLIASTTSDENAQYTLPNLPAGTYTIIGEAWIDGKRYSNAYEVTVQADETVTLFIIMYED